MKHNHLKSQAIKELLDDTEGSGGGAEDRHHHRRSSSHHEQQRSSSQYNRRELDDPLAGLDLGSELNTPTRRRWRSSPMREGLDVASELSTPMQA